MKQRTIPVMMSPEERVRIVELMPHRDECSDLLRQQGYRMMSCLTCRVELRLFGVTIPCR